MSNRIVTSSLAVACAGLIFFAGCKEASTSPYGGTTTTPPAAIPPNTVVIAYMAFSPASITVVAGTTITWTNNDGTPHSSTSDTGVWDSGVIPNGGSKTATFNTVGTYPYHCLVHGSMMTGTVIVK